MALHPSAMGRANRTGSRLAGLACGTALAFSMTGNAHAQDQAAQSAAANANAAPEIVVTARFRAESTQNTPISITALSGKTLETRGIQSVEGIARSAPNVTLEKNSAGYGKSVIAYIRGVGQSDFLPSFEPGVGIYIDNVYLGTAFGSLFDFSDISQVEILRGPQGTLFGKNNEGGAVQVSTRKAVGDGSGYVEVGLGNFNRKSVKAAFDMSIVPDKVFLRVSGGFNKIDGYVDTIDFTCANPTLAGSKSGASSSRSTRRVQCEPSMISAQFS